MERTRRGAVDSLWGRSRPSPAAATLGSAVRPDTRSGVQFAELIEPIGVSIQSTYLDGADECMS